MFSVPFPVISVLILFFLLFIPFLSGKKYHPGTLYFLIFYLVMLSLGTLRWTYHSDLLRNLQSGLAMLLPPTAWYCLVSMTQGRRSYDSALLFLPCSVLLFIATLWPFLTDALLILLFLGYGCGLLAIAHQTTYRSTLSRLGYRSQTTNLAFMAGCFLSISALTDLLVAISFNNHHEQLAPGIIIIGQITLYPVVILMFIFSERLAPLPSPEVRETRVPAGPKECDENLSLLYEGIEKQVRESQLYLNPNLTLIILARKTGIPARQLSKAVNTVIGCNVSQWINGFRIEWAKGLLTTTPLPITEVMLDSGFITKSNFNREFQRIVGISPTVFRQQVQGN